MNINIQNIKHIQIILKSLFIAILLLGLLGEVKAQSVISSFEGSETWGKYNTNFERLALTESGDIKKIFTVEGRLESHIYKKSSSKSNLEVLRSYESELKAAGFSILSNSTDKNENYRLINQLYGSKYNNIGGRNYSHEREGLLPNYQVLLSTGEYYLAAKKQMRGKAIYVAIVLNNQGSNQRDNDVYLVDILEVADMETDTVRISEELLKSTIESEGKFVIYSIYFDTGKFIILPESRATLETISKFLKNNSGKQFFIVGHTDATGTFSGNMDLSERRAAAVVNALQTQFGISEIQLQPKGVGPLAPVATNQTADGRKLNRRVEMVLILRE